MDRLRRLRVSGMRTLEGFDLPMEGLTVLIGENGSGKSTILEALEILRAAPSGSFFDRLHDLHGGLLALLRKNSRRMSLEVEVSGEAEPIEYSVMLAEEGGMARIVGERLCVGPLTGHDKPLTLIERTYDSCRVFDERERKLVEHELSRTRLALAEVGSILSNPAVSRTREALDGIDVHVPFDVTARWAARSANRDSLAREAVPLRDASRLGRFGANLPNAFLELRNRGEQEWRHTMDLVRMGLGDDVDSVLTPTASGRLGLSLKYGHFQESVPAQSLSDGALAYLATVALLRLGNSASAICLDEPDVHLHPRLLSRVVGFLEEMAEETPVVVATHSDRLLDFLSQPAEAVVLCELDDERRTRMLRASPDELDDWLGDYRGLGDLRAEGFHRLVMNRTKEPRSGEDS